jgi:hypothetical protein
MTVIAGYTNGNTWAIAADSGLFEEGGDDAPDTGIYFLGLDSKVWRVEKSLMGMSGTSRVDEIARNAGTGDPYKLRDILKAAEVTGEWTLLVVTQKGLYYLAEDFSVIKLKNKYFAIGVACQPALGSLSTSHLLNIPVVKAVKLAVKAAIDNSIYAVAPITSKVLEDKKPS